MMNLTTILKTLGNGLRHVGGNALLVAKKNGPALAIAGGIGGFVLTIVETVKATNRTNELLETKEEKIQRFNNVYQENPEDPKYTMIDLADDVKTVTTQTKWALVRTWLPVATTGTVSIILVLTGYKILNGRYVATAAAYKALENGFERYRENVISEFGKDTDWRMANSVKADEVEQDREERRKAKLESGDKPKKKTMTRYQRESATAVFDNVSCRWRNSWTPDQVWEYLKIVESQMNDQLQYRKHLFLNEVYDRLDLPRTEEGQVLGWIVTREHPTHVSFGLDEMPDDAVRDFMSETINENIWIRLHFNVDGMILHMIDMTPEKLMGHR